MTNIKINLEGAADKSVRPTPESHYFDLFIYQLLIVLVTSG
jgi:hypothetical protein